MSDIIIITETPSPVSTVIVSESVVTTVEVTAAAPPPETFIVRENTVPASRVVVEEAIPQTLVVTTPATQGPAGQGVPVGGAAGQVLAKIDSANFNTEWVAAGGGGSGNSYFPGGW